MQAKKYFDISVKDFDLYYQQFQQLYIGDEHIKQYVAIWAHIKLTRHSLNYKDQIRIENCLQSYLFFKCLSEYTNTDDKYIYSAIYSKFILS